MNQLRTRPIDAEAFGCLQARHDDLVTRMPSLPAPYFAPYVDTPVAALDGERPWLVAAATHDPMRDRTGRYVVPAPALARLREIAATGVRFDAVVVAHELDPEGPVRDLLPALARGPVACPEHVARALVGSVPDDPRTATLTRALDRVVAAAARAGRAAGAPGRAVVEALKDPAVLGVIVAGPPRAGRPAYYYPLTAWRW